MEQVILRKLEKAINAMLDVLADDDDYGFENEGQRLRYLFHKLREQERRWRSSHPCMFPGCTDRSVRRSHTIPKSGPLRMIAEDGHVITPEMGKSGLTASLTGVGEASAFPGFCTTHEQLFQGFEQRKKLDGATDMALQCFRVVCREIRIKEEQKRLATELLADHKERIGAKGAEILNRLLGEDFIMKHSVSTVDIQDHDPYCKALKSDIEQLSNTIDEYQSDFFQPLIEEYEGRGEHFSAIAVTLHKQLPVSLGGRGNFRVQVADDVQDVTALLNVWPRSSETDCTMVVKKEHQAAVRQYFGAYGSPTFRLVSMIEGWMVHGTDHWFIKPSAWNAIPSERQTAILADILDCTRNIGHEYVRSIFDDLRQEAIRRNEHDIRPEVQQWLEHEKRKLDLPGDCRPPSESR